MSREFKKDKRGINSGTYISCGGSGRGLLARDGTGFFGTTLLRVGKLALRGAFLGRVDNVVGKDLRLTAVGTVDIVSEVELLGPVFSIL